MYNFRHIAICLVYTMCVTVSSARQHILCFAHRMLSHVSLSVFPSVRHTSGSDKNGQS